MRPKLTPAQLNLLRRCSGGLSMWEVGEDRIAVVAQLVALCQLRLVCFDEQSGYDTTAAGEAWLADLDE